MFNRNTVGLPFLNEYFLYHEDTYLSWRMRLRGHDVRMCPDSLVLHKGNATTNRQRSDFITFFQERNRILNLLLFYELRTLIRLIPFVLGDVLAKTVVSVVSKRKSFPATLRAYWWLVTHLPWILKKRRREQSARKIEDKAILALMSADVIDEARSPEVFHSLNRISRLYARVVGLPYHRATVEGE